MRFFYGCHLNSHDFATERLLASTRGRGRGRKILWTGGAVKYSHEGT